MKRYIKEMANDVRKDIIQEIKINLIPYENLAKLVDDVDFIVKGNRNGLLTDRDSVSALSCVWNDLRNLNWEYTP